MSERPITSRMALSATAFTVPSGILDVEQIFADAGRLHLPEHREIDVDDVLVAGEHQAFLRHVARRWCRRAPIVDLAHADVDLVDAQRLGREHGLDRIRQVVIQAGLHLAHFLAEAQHDAELVRLDPEEAGEAPQRDRRQRRAARSPCRRDCRPAGRAAACPGRGAAFPPDPAASVPTIAVRSPRGPCRRRAPRAAAAAALIGPWHELISRRRGL